MSPCPKRQFYNLLKLFRARSLGSRKRVSFGKVMLLVLVFFAVCITEGILVRLSIVYFPHLGVYGFLGLLITISLILSFENRKQLSLAKLVFEASIEALMVTDIDNNIIVINPAFTEMTGYTLK
jgi:PAS domain-containing protein